MTRSPVSGTEGAGTPPLAALTSAEEWRDFMPGQWVAEFRIVGALASDDSALTLLAEASDAEPGARVVLAVLRDLVPDNDVASIERAGRTMRALAHPGLAPVLDVGALPNRRAYVAFAHVSGAPLLDHCRDRDLGLRERLDLFRAICRALRYAHAHLVVHGRLRACDVVVGADGQPVVLGTGLEYLRARIEPFSADTADGESERLGSTAADIRDLGELLYEILSGHAGAPSDRDPAHRLHGDLDAIVCQARDADPHRRYGSVEALERDLGWYLRRRGAPTSAAAVARRLSRFIGSPVGGVVVSLAVSAIAVLATIAFGAERNRAMAAASMARAEQATASEVSNFLIALFDGAETGATSDLRAMLDQGRTSIARDSRDRPEVRSAMLHAMATAYAGLERESDARELFAEAIQLRRSLGPSQSLPLARSLTGLALVLGDSGEWENAAPVAREAHAFLLVIGTTDPRDLIAAKEALGLALASLGRLEEADVLLRDAARLSSVSFGEGSREHAEALLQLAEAARSSSRTDEALLRYKVAREPMARAFPRGHARMLDFHLGLAAVFGAQGDLRRQERELRDVIARQLTLQGSRTLRSATALEALAENVNAQGRYLEAVSVGTEALELVEQSVGRGQPRWAWAATSLARLQTDVGDIDVAESLLRAALSTKGLSARSDSRARYELARLLMLNQQYQEAEAFAQAACANTAAVPGWNGQMTVWCRVLLAEVWLSQGRPAEAGRELDAARAIPGDASPVERARRIAAIDSASAQMAEQKGAAETAVILRRAAVERLVAALGQDHPASAEARLRQADVLARLGRKEEARQVLASAMPVLSAQLSERSPVRKAALALMMELAR